MVKTFSIIIPVYRNSESIPDLIVALSNVAATVRRRFDFMTEVVFVVDGSPDDSYAQLERLLPKAPFASQLLLHSRNFGSFAAIRTGLEFAQGDFFGVIAADLQEPPELLLNFLEKLYSNEFDIVVGSRESRHDPLMTSLISNLFWKSYKKLVIPDIPQNGVDVFGCNLEFRNHLLELGESNSSLVGLVFWLGFRRTEVLYTRQARQHGKSAWTVRKKLNYLLDSIFSFTDLPIKILSGFGLLGISASLIFGLAVLLAKIVGGISVPGYAATVLIVTFFGGLNSLGLGIVGAYAWRAYENTKGRPLSIVMKRNSYNKPI